MFIFSLVRRQRERESGWRISFFNSRDNNARRLSRCNRIYHLRLFRHHWECSNSLVVLTIVYRFLRAQTSTQWLSLCVCASVCLFRPVCVHHHYARIWCFADNVYLVRSDDGERERASVCSMSRSIQTRADWHLPAAHIFVIKLSKSKRLLLLLSSPPSVL